MLTFAEGNIFLTECKTILHPVNAEGTMMSSLSREFYQYFPEMHQHYQNLCKEPLVHKTILGKVIYHKLKPIEKREFTESIISYVFRKKWDGKIPEYYLGMGLGNLVECIINNDIKSIAIPAFGCGKPGGCAWGVMKNLMQDWHRLYKDILKDVYIYSYAPLQIKES